MCAFSLVGIITACLQFSISRTKLLGDSLPVTAADSWRCINAKVISCLFSLPAPSLGSPCLAVLIYEGKTVYWVKNGQNKMVGLVGQEV